MPPTDWSDQLRLAEFDRLVDGVRRWVETAPAWPPFDSQRALWARIAPRVEQLRVELDRLLVVGVVGGTGTGKSTLLNALVGQRVCPAGDTHRPTTVRPVILAHTDVDQSLVQIEDGAADVQHLAATLLEHVILIDCPDPDTQSRDGNGAAGGSRNLDTLRRVLPLCDVLLCTGTAQKYKTHAVAEELLQHAPGRQIVFVQTHAAVDADITADWQRQLESQGFSVPRMFYLDGQEALERAEAHRPPPPEFGRLVDYLREQLADRAGQRILRANALDLLDWFLGQSREQIEGLLPPVARLERAVVEERAKLFDRVRSRLDEGLRGNRGVWRARLLREVTIRWGWGPFAAFLRLLPSARSFLRFVPALRARGLAPMMVAGGIGLGQTVADRVRQSLAENNWLAAAEVGLTEGEIAQSHSVLAGFAQEAGIDPPQAGKDGDELAAATTRLYQHVEVEIEGAIERRAARRAGAFIHGLLEVLFMALPALLLYRLGKNFFYEHLWLESSQLLLGVDFLVQSALWVLVWGLLLRGLLTWRLQRGIARDLRAMLDRLTPQTALGPLFGQFERAAAAIREHTDRIGPLRAELARLRRSLESSQPWQLGRLTGTKSKSAANERE